MKTYSPIDTTFPCYVQPKLNGVNCTLGTDGLLRSRTGKYFPAVQKAFDWPKPPLELYGELYHYGWSLQRIIAAVTPDEPTEDTHELALVCFDSAEQGNFPERLEATERWLPRHSAIEFLMTIRCDSVGEIDYVYESVLCQLYEGIVIRDLFGGVWKRKPYKDSEYLCVGVIEGKGKRAGHVGKFVLQLPDGRTFNSGGGQVSYPMLRHLFEQPPIGKMITVRYYSVSEDNIPLCAQFISVRDYE